MKTKTLFFSLAVSGLLFVATGCNFALSTNANNSAANTIAPSGTPASASAESQNSSVETLVADLYKAHDGKKSPFFQTKDRSLVDKFFTKPLADLIWKDANSSSGEVGAIDGDPLYNAQDTEIKNFAIGKSVVKGTTATVPVTFTNFGEKQTLTFSLKQANGSWRIDNISYGGGDSLMKWLTSTYSEITSNGEFEGKYQVGETTCTVKPVKMAFDVRWAKGSGVETFVFTDNNSFESAPGQSGSNKFVFDDDNYNTGTFYRADGKEFPIKRVK